MPHQPELISTDLAAYLASNGRYDLLLTARNQRISKAIMVMTGLLLIFIVLYSANTFGAVTKCTDASGSVTYTDGICNVSANPEHLQIQPKAETTAHEPQPSIIPDKLKNSILRNANADQASSTAPAPAQPKPSLKYNCDGRTHCSHMTSCEEAKFFINNCPNTKMDGNNDGIPCEKQWCQ